MMAGPEPRLDDVLRRAGEYAVRYHAAMTSVIAEEHYVQKIAERAPRGVGLARMVTFTKERTLRSDFIIISGTGSGEPRWMAFRDVQAVDGRPVREPDDRLRKLFAAGGDAIDRASAISRESARYNLEPEGFLRTINVPTVALEFLLPENRDRFSFRHKAARDRQAGGHVWDIEYREREHPSIIRTPEGRSVLSRGTFRIDPRDGRIEESTLEVWDGRGTITVFYEVDARLGIAVPVVMKERYVLNNALVEGEAAYSNFRRFETGVRIVPR